jgi:hypothetical protein
MKKYPEAFLMLFLLFVPLFINAQGISGRSNYPKTTMQASSFLGYASFNPAYLSNVSRFNIDQFDENKDSSAVSIPIYIIEAGQNIGYIGINELNPSFVNIAALGDGFGIALGASSVSHDLFQDITFNITGAYSFTRDISFGASYMYSLFSPQGYESVGTGVLNFSTSLVIDENSTAYFAMHDALDARLSESLSDFVSGRELFAGYEYIGDRFGGGIEFQVNEVRGGVNPFFSFFPIEELRIYAMGRSISRSIAIGSAINYRNILVTGEVIYSNMLGSDLSLTLGYRF